ncbi:hypothetical protein SRABI118_03168 [Massilia sp. Bi118]|uniref:hypothetical protein n=1 Tax=Massilia sp. Bi118 TaxID=2822346 RepID=UPI001D6A9051|nr:hypothetical protein [Massilia sp. Bi118]CAH0259120.1 hypothetical protein SRABI118_03168 [Massilia sp. Bi118]
MNGITPKRKYLIVLLGTIVTVSLLYQVVKGWNTLDFVLRVGFVTAIALVTRRSSEVFLQAYAGSERRLATHAACWVLAALALFAGLMLSA